MNAKHAIDIALNTDRILELTYTEELYCGLRTESESESQSDDGENTVIDCPRRRQRP